MRLPNLERFDIVIVGIQHWELPIGSNCKDIARELAKTCRVLFVNPPVDRVSRFRERKRPDIQLRLANRGTSQLKEDNLWVYYPSTITESLNWLPDNWVFNALNYWNNYCLATEIRKATRQLDFGEFLVFNDSDMFRSFYLKELLKPKLYLYYTRDNLLADGYFGKHGTRLEALLMQKADAVLSNSTYLARLASRFTRDSFFIGQGCEPDRFRPDVTYPVPDDLQKIAGPRIGYVGALSSLRLDTELLSALAVRRPDWNLVLVGPEDEVFRRSTLHRLPNVFFLGNKPGHEVPAYVQHLDVLLNPQKLNEVTIGNYPRKIDEYLAMGRPVVALRTEAMLMFEEHVRLATDVDSFVISIEKALYVNEPEASQRAIAFAREHTWSNCIRRMEEVITNLLPTEEQAHGKAVSA